MFGPSVRVVAGRITENRDPLFPEESIAVANAVPQRVVEFTAGRALARKAIQLLGGDIAAIPMRENRTPVWPPGFVASISHSGDICAVAAASSEFVCSLGLDVEQNDLTHAGVLRFVCAPDELFLAQTVIADRALAPRVLFSAKEAFFKAYFPIFASFVDFLDIRVNLSLTEGTISGEFSVVPVSPLLFDQERYEFLGRWKCAGGVILTGVTCCRPAP